MIYILCEGRETKHWLEEKNKKKSNSNPFQLHPVDRSYEIEEWRKKQKLSI